MTGAPGTELSRRPEKTSLARFGVRGMVIVYLGAFVLLPLSAVVEMGFGKGLSAFVAAITSPDTLAALSLTLQTSLAMALINAVMGTWIAYVLVRVAFPGRGLVNALIDLPFAIPTLVTGVMLVVLFGPQSAFGLWFGEHGVRIMYAKPGIVLALLFVTLPFVVRTVQPVLLETDVAYEEAAITLGASPFLAFRRVTLPALLPAIRTGTLLSFARALGEFGSIVIVSGNIPRRTLSAAVLIYGEIESGHPEVAAAVSSVLLAVAFTSIVAVETLQGRAKRELA
jgi:sulfate/thiosulfate transport system permease protein